MKICGKKLAPFRFVALVLVFQMLICGAFASPVYAKNKGGNDEGTEADPIGSGLYNVSTALAAYVNAVVVSNGSDKHPDPSKLEQTSTVGDAGAYVGIGDVKRGFNEGIISSGTAGSVTTSYSAWEGTKVDGGRPYKYLRYGYLLNDLGLDTVSASGTHIARRVGGVATMVMFAGSEFVPQVFNFGIKLLKWLNPFNLLLGNDDEGLLNGDPPVADPLANVNTDVQWNPSGGGATRQRGFFGGGSNSSRSDYVANTNETVAYGDNDAYTNVQDAVTKIYHILYRGTWMVTIPILLALLIFNLLVFKSPNKIGKVKTFLIRVFLLGCSLPIMVVAYTASLNSLSETLESRTPSARVVCATYVDFGTWVDTSRLAPAGSITSNGTGNASDPAQGASGTASAVAVRNVRANAYAINARSGISTGSLAYNRDSFMNVGEWNSSVGTWNNNTVSSSMLTRTLNMLQRYVASDFYDASAWQSAFAGWVSGLSDTVRGVRSSTGQADSNENTVYAMFNNTDAVDDWLDRELSDGQKIFNGSIWSGFNVFRNGTLNGSGSPQASSDIRFNGSGGGGLACNPTTAGGLSVLSMYNYLMSSFQSGQVRIYSPDKSVSDGSKQSHFTVSLVGSGALKFIMGFNAFVLCGALVIVSLVVVLGMVVSNLKSSFKILASLPGFALGLFSAMATVIATALGMILSVMVSAFFVTISGEMFLFLATITETTVLDMVDNATSTILLNSSLTSLGLNVNMQALLNHRCMIYMGLLFASGLVMFTGWSIYYARFAFFRVYNMAWIKLYKLALPAEFAPVLDDLVDGNPSLYPWNWVRDDLTRLGKRLRDIPEGLEPVPAFVLGGGC